MKILIIEDEKLLADSLKTLLELKGFEVEAVYDGETGAEYAETGIYDLLTRVWGYDSNAVENNVEVYIGFLRKKLMAIGSNVRIESIRLLGYHLEVEQP